MGVLFVPWLLTWVSFIYGAPPEWTAYPPCILPPEGYAHVFLYAGSDAQGALTRLELVVHLDGGRILYKAKGSDLVALRVTWPSDS